MASTVIQAVQAQQPAQGGAGGAGGAGGTAAKAPPPPAIPGMEQGTPGVRSADQLRQDARTATQNAAQNAAQNARTAAQEAAQQLRDANNALRDLQRQGRPGDAGTLVPPQFPINPRDMIPPQAVDITVAFFVTVAVCLIGFPLARAFARRIDRRTERMSGGADDMAPRMAQLQDSVDAMAIELERISESQRFQSKLLAERAKDTAALGR